MIAGKRILLVTSVNLSANPRALKEIRTLHAHGAVLTVVKFAFNNWSNAYEPKVEATLPGVTWIRVSATRKPFVKWAASTLASDLSGKLLKLSPDNTALLAYSLDKRSYLLNSALKDIKPAFDLVIAHNPGAFYPVYHYATTHKIPYAIDIEDYHPGEAGKVADPQMIVMMQATLADAVYISGASPLILEHVSEDVGQHKKTQLVNNVFSLELQPSFKTLPLSPLRMFWFSQYVGLNRGLQDAVSGMDLIDDITIELIIAGNCSDEVKKELSSLLTNNKHKLLFEPPRDEKALVERASECHIGLALEPGFSLNNDLALSNKLMTYLLAGNAIIASDTQAQKQFMTAHPEAGVLYLKNDAAAFAACLRSLYHDEQALNAKRQSSYTLGATRYNWEAEAPVFLDLLQHI